MKRKKVITKTELEELYNNNLNKYVCKKLGITNDTLIAYLQKYNIPLKTKGNRVKKLKIIID